MCENSSGVGKVGNMYSGLPGSLAIKTAHANKVGPPYALTDKIFDKPPKPFCAFQKFTIMTFHRHATIF